jgi:HEAT repeat protein
MLTLRTGRGVIELKRGGRAFGDVSDMQTISDNSLRSSEDPKPNPNPNPEYNPDPNLNPDVEEATDASSGPDDPTGERVPVTIPDNLISRFSDAAIRSWPDARAIARLRDIAATHVKQHPADFVRERAEWALTLVRNGEIVTPLRSALTSGDWRVRAYAAMELGETRDPRAADPLIEALRDPHWRVRMHAAAGLQRIGGASAVNGLISVLTDSYWQVRISAIDALAAIGDRRAVGPLRTMAERDSRWMVRDQARNALERIR